MKDRDVRRLERIERVETFLDDHIADFAPGGIVATTLGEIRGIISDLGKASVGQIRTPLTKDEILDDLRIRFKAISLTSRSIHTKYPDFPAEDFRFPAEDSENAYTTHADHLLTLLLDTEDDTPGRLARKDRPPRPLHRVRDACRLRHLPQRHPHIPQRRQRRKIQRQPRRPRIHRRDRHPPQPRQRRRHHPPRPIQNKYASQPDKIHAWKRASRVESDPSPPEDPEPAPEP